MQTVNESPDPVLFSLFLFVCFCFLGMNEVSLLYFILSLRAFRKLKMVAWALQRPKAIVHKYLTKSMLVSYVNHHRDLISMCHFTM